MTEKINATCSICGKGYYKCISCRDFISLNPWKKYTCTSEHYKIYQILRGFNTGVYNKEEAKSKLQMVDLSDFDGLRDNIKNIINDIMCKDENMVNEVVETESLLNESDMSDIDDNTESVFEQAKIIRKKKSSKMVETE